MLRLKLLGGAAALVLISTAAYAFQEQQATTPRAAEPQQAQPAVASPLSPDAAPATRGTTVRIPGLGTLGVIPKMDFGLELLYGAADQQSKRPDPSKTDQDDVLVGGRIKHKF